MKKIRVGIDARLVPGQSGGVEQVVKALLETLAGFPQVTEEYHVLVWPESKDWSREVTQGRLRYVLDKSQDFKSELKRLLPAKWQGGLTTRISKLPLGYFEPIPSRRRTPGLDFDVMHFTHQSAFLTDIPSIYHPHDLQHVHLPQFFSPRERSLRQRHYRAFAGEARLVVVTSQWVQRDVVTHLGCPSDKVAVIPWPCFITPLAAPSRSEIASAQSKIERVGHPYVIYPAQTWPHKNHEILLRALSKIADRNVELSLILTGRETTHAKTLKALASDLAINSRVHFMGYLPYGELQVLVQNSFAVVVPSKFEAASGPVWEAFQLEVPVLASHVTSLPSQVGDAGLLLDPDDAGKWASALENLLTNPRLRATLIAKGREKVRNYTWESTGMAFRYWYRVLAGQLPHPQDEQALEKLPNL